MDWCRVAPSRIPPRDSLPREIVSRCSGALAILATMAGCASVGPQGSSVRSEQPAPPCASPGERLSPAQSSSALIATHGTSIDPYKLTDAVWLEGRPIAVNRAFDFATAMMMPGLGAGLAAAQRQKANLKDAETLSNLALPPSAGIALDSYRQCGTHVYVLLWSDANAREVLVVGDALGAAPQGSPLDPTLVDAICADLVAQIELIQSDPGPDVLPSWSCRPATTEGDPPVP